ncbi:MAG: methyltransferase domain-containing protein [Burkholderiales bacterium]
MRPAFGLDEMESTSSTTVDWDGAAAGWNRHAGVIRTWLAPATSAMLDAAGVAANARVLDIAAGSGDQTLDVALRVGTGGHVLATDSSPVFLELARQNMRNAGMDQVETRLADAQALGLAGAGFDAAVCRLGLMFCELPDLALSGIRSALRPRARFATLVFSQPSANPCVAIMAKVARRHAGLPRGDPFAPGALMSLGKPGHLQDLLGDAGFSDVEVTAVAAPFRMRSCQDYIGFVRSSGSPIIGVLHQLSAPARQDAWDDMAEQLNRFTQADGWEGPNELLLGSGAVRP